jgi:hypothetical protein
MGSLCGLGLGRVCVCVHLVLMFHVKRHLCASLAGDGSGDSGGGGDARSCDTSRFDNEHGMHPHLLIICIPDE